MSDDMVGDETISASAGDWCMGIGLAGLLACWLVVLCMYVWSGIEWVLSL